MREFIGNNVFTFPIGPILSNSDGLTPVTSIALSACNYAAVRKYGNPTPVSIAANSWGNTASMGGYFDLTLTSSQCDTLGPLAISIQLSGTIVPFFDTIDLVTSAYWLSKHGTDPIATQISSLDVRVQALPNSSTLNALALTLPNSAAVQALPTSATQYAQFATLPTSLTVNEMVATLPNSQTLNALGITLPTSAMVALLPTSATHGAQMATLPTSAMVAVLPTSAAFGASIATLPTSTQISTLPNSLTFKAWVDTLPTSTQISTLPSSTTLNAHILTLPTSSTLRAVSVQITSLDVRVSSLSTGGGATAQEVWDYGSRTLTSAGASGATQSEVQSACASAIVAYNLQTLISSQDIGALFATLPNSSTFSVVVGSVDARFGTLPTSQTLNAHIATLPNSSTVSVLVSSLNTRVSSVDARVATHPTSATLNALGITLPTSAMVAVLPTSATQGAQLATLPTSQTLNAWFITLPTSAALSGVSIQVGSLDVRVSSISAGGGASAADVWDYGSRTLTSAGAGGATQAECQSACYSAIVAGYLMGSGDVTARFATLPTSLTLNAWMITMPTSAMVALLPTSATLNALGITLPTSAMWGARVNSLDARVSSVQATANTLPNSSNLAGQIATLPNSLTLAAGLATLPTSQALRDQILTLPTSQTLSILVGSLDIRVQSLDTRISSVGVSVSLLPTSQTITAAISSVDARVSGLNNLSLSQVTSGIFGYPVDSGWTFLNEIRVQQAKACNVASGGGTSSLVYRDKANSKNRLVMTVDSAGNRSAVTRDGD